MAIDVYWGSGSPYAWRVLLALEYKRLPYVSHLLQFSKQEHKSPQMLALNPRGRVPVLKDGDYVCFESLAILYYLDLKYPQPPIFGRTPEEAGHHHAGDLRVPGVHRAARRKHHARGVLRQTDLAGDEITAAMHAVANEARTIEVRLSKSDWIVGESLSAVDMVIFPGIQLLKRALERPQARRRCPRASCRWRSTIRRSVAGSRASRRCRATSAPIRRTGAGAEPSQRAPRRRVN